MGTTWKSSLPPTFKPAPFCSLELFQFPFHPCETSIYRTPHEALESPSVGQCADLRRRDAGPDWVSHTGEAIDDDRLHHEQSDAGLKDEQILGPGDYPK